MVNYEYDSLKRCIQENYYNKDKKLTFKTINKYSRDSIIQEKVIFNEFGNICSKSIYDEKGNLTDTKRFDPDGNVILYSGFDERGNLMEEISTYNALDYKTTYT